MLHQNLIFLLSCLPVWALQAPTHAPSTESTQVIYKSTDGGKSWSDFSKGLPADIKATDISTHQGVLYLSSEKGVFYSQSTATTPDWTKEYFMPEPNSRLIEGTMGPYAVQYRHSLYQKLFSSGVWIPLHLSLKDVSVRTLIETADGGIVIGTETGIYKTTDRAQTWTWRLEKEMIHSIINTGDALLASGDHGMYRSDDQGNSWIHIPALGSIVRLSKSKNGRINAFVESFSKNQKGMVSPALLHALYSDDGGRKWNCLEYALPCVSHIFEIHQIGNLILCSHDQGLSRSLDQGRTWENVELPGKIKGWINLLVIDEMLFITEGTGC